MATPKVTIKAIPYYPDIHITEQPCDCEETWEEFLTKFHVDLAKVAPEENFIVKSRKGTSSTKDKIEVIASKYVQKYKILVTIRRQRGKRLRKRTLPNLTRLANLGTSDTSQYLPSLPTPIPATSEIFPETVYAPHLLTALRDSNTISTPANPQRRSPIFLQIQSQSEPIRPSIASNTFKVPDMDATVQLYKHQNKVQRIDLIVPLPPQLSNRTSHLPMSTRSPFTETMTSRHSAPFSSDLQIEKMEDYHVIRRSNVIWELPPQHPIALPPLQSLQSIRCFSMTDYDFNL